MTEEILDDGAQQGRVVRVTACRLRVVAGPWPFADLHAGDIDRHWEKKRAERPRFFNGPVHIVVRHAVAGGMLAADLIRTDFKSFLYCRDAGWPDPSVMDAFGCALIRSAEGHLLLGRQREGNLNSGLVYPPSGFIDPADIGPDGGIDIEGSVAREVREETGFHFDDFDRCPGLILGFSGPTLAIGIELRSRHPSAALVSRIMDRIRADPDSELAQVMAVGSADELSQLEMLPHGRLLARWILDGA